MQQCSSQSGCLLSIFSIAKRQSKPKTTADESPPSNTKTLKKMKSTFHCIIVPWIFDKGWPLTALLLMVVNILVGHLLFYLYVDCPDQAIYGGYGLPFYIYSISDWLVYIYIYIYLILYYKIGVEAFRAVLITTPLSFNLCCQQVSSYSLDASPYMYGLLNPCFLFFIIHLSYYFWCFYSVFRPGWQWVHPSWICLCHIAVHEWYRFLQMFPFHTNYFNIAECWVNN